eukprot:scaffold3624_cov69-Skeletonema_dohrnii-CCMP3373.AAC.5
MVQRRGSDHRLLIKGKRQLRKLRGRNTDMNALLMDAQIKSSMEEYALDMGQSADYATVKDAQIKSLKEVCALNMEQSRRSNYALLMDAQIQSSMEECALRMGQR